MTKPAIIIDLDGTAIDSPTQKLPSQRLIAAVAKLQSRYHIASATGRVWSFAKPVIQGLGLTDPCIISAGTQICNPQTGQILWQKTLAPVALAQALALLQKYPKYKLLYNDSTEDDYFYGGVSPSEFKPTEPIYFLEQIFVPDAVALEIQALLNQIAGIVCVMVVAQKPGTRDLHILNTAATKEHAIAELLQLMQVPKTQTIGIGDGHNDLHLFNGVQHKVAMGNAVAELKNQADTVIGQVSHDGLAEYFEKLTTQ